MGNYYPLGQTLEEYYWNITHWQGILKERRSQISHNFP